MNKVIFGLYLGWYWRDYLEYSYLALEGLSWILILRTFYAWAKNSASLVAVGHYEHLPWRTWYIFGCTLASIGGNVFIIHSLQCPHKRYQQCKFDCNHSIIKGFNLSIMLINPLNTELNPIFHLLAFLAHHIVHVSRVRVNFGSKTINQIMLYHKI